MNRIIFLLIFAFVTTVFVSKAQLQAVPTFASCSIYLPLEKAESCTIFFKRENDKQWTEAFAPVYDTVRQEYRTSLVRLTEQTKYLVKAELKHQGKTSEIKAVSFVTWNSNPVIAQTIPLSKFLVAGKVEIKGIKGTENGWVRIVGDVKIDAGEEQDYAVSLRDCHYVIIEGAEIKGGAKHAIYTEATSDHIRIINCDISKWGRTPISQNEKGVYLDRNKSSLNGHSGIKLDQPLNVVVERCYIHDPNGFTNPWNGTITMGEFKGKSFKGTHPEGPNAINVRNARGGVVVRYCDLSGSQTRRYDDPFESPENGNLNGGLNKDADVYGNMLAFAEDDGIELDGGQCNIRMFDNRIEQTMTGISLAPNKKGPSYIFNNVVWNLGNSEGHATVGVKNGGGSEHSLGTQFLINNTMLNVGPIMAGVGFGTNPNRALFRGYTRNNIFLVTGAPGADEKPDAKANVVNDKAPFPLNSFDYDRIANIALPLGEQAATAMMAGNEVNAVWSLPQFTDPAHGVFTLRSSDKGIDKGTKVANFNQQYSGQMPDLGAFEIGSGTLTPVRPVAMEADKYFLLMSSDQTETLTITTGKIGGKHSYRILKNADMEWLAIDRESGTVADQATIAVKLTAKAGQNVHKGIIFFRLDNGFSIPVTITLKKP